MKKSLIYFTLLFLLFSSSKSLSQTGFQKASKFWNGIFFNVGIHQTHFLNNNYQMNINDGLIEVGIGWQLGLNCILHPIEIDASYYSHRYGIEDIGQRPDDLKPIQLSGIETTVFYALIPDIKYIIPLLGLGYHFGKLSLEEDEAIQGVGSEVKVKSPHLAAKLRFKFGISMEIFYKRSLSSPRPESDIYSYGVSLLISFNNFRNKNND